MARDRHAELLAALAVAGADVERLATEVRHLQRTEVREAEEPFAEGQKGSSAMPHKRNPIVAERLVGMARLLRGYAVAGLEDVALWHERDISHSAVERVALPDACCVLDYALERAHWLVAGLRVSPERMRANLASSGGLAGSSAALLALVDAGWTRRTPTWRCSGRPWRPGRARAASATCSWPSRAWPRRWPGRPGRRPRPGPVRGRGRAVFERLEALR